MKLVRVKKAKVASGRKTKSEIDKFVDQIDVQMRLARGETVKQGRGVARSWMEDGAAYGVAKILNVKIGKLPLHPKSAYVVNMAQQRPPLRELEELRSMTVGGKLNNRIYAVLRAAKKGGRRRAKAT